MAQAAVNKPKIEIVPNPESIARRSLEIFIHAAQKAINEKGVFYIAISGGRTPKEFFELLGEAEQSKALSWDKVHLFWADERYVSPDSELSNFRLAADTFLSKVRIPADNVYRIFTEYRDIHIAAAEYERIIKSVFIPKQNQIPQFDMIFLGLGCDGHIASLFPDSDAVLETKKLVTTVTDSKVKPDRVTLTSPILCAAAKVLILVSGEEKAEIVKKIFTGKPDVSTYPAYVLWPILEKVVWLIDSAAAKLL